MKKVCIVGYGAIAPIHARAIKSICSAELYAVCDINSEKLENVHKQYSDIIAFDSFENTLNDINIDCFHICTPHYLHFSMIKGALDAGKSVVTEKPVTMTKTEFEALLKHKDSKNVCVVFQNRYNPCVTKLFELVNSGKYGKLIGVNANLMWKRDAAYYASEPWRGTLGMEGGGVLINQAIHTLDIAVTLCGTPSSVQANMCNLSLKGVIETEDTLSAVIDFENGSKTVLLATNASISDSSPYIEVMCQNASFIYCNQHLYHEGKCICSDIPADSIGKNCWGMGHLELLKDFYDNSVYLSPKDVKNTMYTTFAIYESAQNNGESTVIDR